MRSVVVSERCFARRYDTRPYALTFHDALKRVAIAAQDARSTLPRRRIIFCKPKRETPSRRAARV